MKDQYIIDHCYDEEDQRQRLEEEERMWKERYWWTDKNKDESWISRVISNAG